jgi:hypothetical protein
VKLAEERGGATWRAIASAAEVRVTDGGVAGEQVQRGVAPKLARQTIKNMVQAGELAEIGRDKPAGSRHYQALYAPAEERYGVMPAGAGVVPLGDALRSMATLGRDHGA